VEQSGGDNAGPDNGRPERSRWRDGGHIRDRWQSNVTTSHSRGTEKDGLQRFEEPTVMVRIMSRAQGIRPLGSRSQWGKFSKRFYWWAWLLVSRLLEFGGYDHETWMDKRWRTLMPWLLENLDCLRKLYFYFFNLAGWMELMLREYRDWWKETKSKSGCRNRFLWIKGRLVNN
jgi:hypothetical protein